MTQAFGNPAIWIDYDLRPQQAVALTLLFGLLTLVYYMIATARKSKTINTRVQVIWIVSLLCITVASGLYIAISYGTLDISTSPFFIRFFLRGQTYPGVGLFTEHLWFWPVFLGIPILNALLLRHLTRRSTRTLPLSASSTTATRRFGSAG